MTPPPSPKPTPPTTPPPSPRPPTSPPPTPSPPSPLSPPPPCMSPADMWKCMSNCHSIDPDQTTNCKDECKPCQPPTPPPPTPPPPSPTPPTPPPPTPLSPPPSPLSPPPPTCNLALFGTVGAANQCSCDTANGFKWVQPAAGNTAATESVEDGGCCIFPLPTGAGSGASEEPCANKGQAGLCCVQISPPPSPPPPTPPPPTPPPPSPTPPT